MQDIVFLSSSLCLFSAVGDCTAMKFLREIYKGEIAYEAVKAYSKLLSLLICAKKSLGEILHDCARYDDNSFMRSNSYNKHENISENIENAARYDLAVLKQIAEISFDELQNHLAMKFPEYVSQITALPKLLAFSDSDAKLDWSVKGFARLARENGYGEFARYTAFEFTPRGELVPIPKPDRIKLSELKGYEVQRGKLVENTEHFLAGLPAGNALLYGDRGTGKSSTVKALLNEYAAKGLRIIQLSKEAASRLSELMRIIEQVPLKFIVFMDDLTFNEDEECFAVLKAALEGSLISRPENMVIYATTNRRHLIKESFHARQGDEVHRGDAIDESLSLSDRFGLYITFSIPAKDEFLRIVKMLASDAGIDIDNEELEAGAERFALLRAGRSPRIARQYIDSVIAKLHKHNRQD